MKCTKKIERKAETILGLCRSKGLSAVYPSDCSFVEVPRASQTWFLGVLWQSVGSMMESSRVVVKRKRRLAYSKQVGLSRTANKTRHFEPLRRSFLMQVLHVGSGHFSRY